MPSLVLVYIFFLRLKCRSSFMCSLGRQQGTLLGKQIIVMIFIWPLQLTVLWQTCLNTTNSSTYSSNACRGIGSAWWWVPYGMGKTWGVRTVDFVVVEVSLELPDCLGLPRVEESILHTLSLDHVGRKSRAEPGEFEEQVLKKWWEAGNVNWSSNLPVPGLLTVLGCCACCWNCMC